MSEPLIPMPTHTPDGEPANSWWDLAAWHSCAAATLKSAAERPEMSDELPPHAPAQYRTHSALALLYEDLAAHNA